MKRASGNSLQDPGPDRLKTLLGGGILIVLCTLFVYSPVFDAGFTNWDDGMYVEFNRDIRGLSGENIAKAITGSTMGNYHPLTMLSYATEYAVFGLNPRVNHLVNLFFHLLATILLLQFIFRLSGKPWVALLTAAWFALHPMHVESVAWISARKDVLFATFYFAGLLYYLDYLQSDKRKALLLSLLFFLFSLLSKPLAVTFPLVLFLVDLYQKRSWSNKLLLEKIPFFLLALIFGLLTLLTQEEAIAIDTGLSAGDRLVLGISNIPIYLAQFFAPVRLSCFYPYPEQLAVWHWVSLAIIPAGLFILWRYRRNRTILFGLLFFLITIIPVLQLLSFGYAQHADRYTYLPYIGLFFLMAMGWAYAGKWKAGLRIPLLAVLLLWTAWLGYLSYQRAAVWKDSIRLWENVLEQYPGVAAAWNNRGKGLYAEGKLREATADFDKAIALDSTLLEAWNNRGAIRYQRGDFEGAISDFSRVIEQRPDYVKVWLNRGNARLALKDLSGAIEDYSREIQNDPENADAFGARGYARALGQDWDLAIQDYEKAAALYRKQDNVAGRQQALQALEQIRKVQGNTEGQNE